MDRMAQRRADRPDDRGVLDPQYSVFNGHVNDADRRARQVLRACGMNAWLLEVEAIEAEEGGIMAIFHCEVTPATAAYAALVTAFVNEGKL